MKRFFDWKDAGVSFSLAVLWFTNVWREFIFSKSYNFYFDYNPVLEYSAMIINVALVTVVFLIFIVPSKYFSNLWLKRIFQSIFFILGLSAFCGLGNEIMKVIAPKTTFFVNPLLPTIILVSCIAFSYKQKFRLEAITSNLKKIALFILPFAFLTCAQLLWIWFNTISENLATKTTVSETQKTVSSKKIVWILFDEADYAVIVNAEKNNFNLSEIKRLMGESFVAENAYPPNVGTQDSIPAMLTGQTLKKTTPSAINDIVLYPVNNSAPFSLRQSDNLIRQLNNSDFKTGIVGWTHPYPRIFNDVISEGYWHSLQHAQCYDLIDCSGYLYRMSLQTIPFMTRFFPSLWFNENKNQIERHKFLSGKANELIARPDIDFLFFHFSIPHGPFLNRQLSPVDEGYFYALETMDDTIKQLRETLEKTGQANNTILIISSDHFLRGKAEKDFEFLPAEQRPVVAGDTRIPFIVKFPGENNRFDYNPAFNTVVTKDLILSISKEEIRTSAELAAKLDNLALTKPELINFRPDVTGLPNFKIYVRNN